MAIEHRVVYLDSRTRLEIEAHDHHQVILTVNGEKFDLDLSANSLAEFRKALEPFLKFEKGAKLHPSLFREIVAAGSSTSRVPRAVIREWWEQNWERLDLPKPSPHRRGRIPQVVEDAFWREHGGRSQ